jgi:DNA-binding CsgD family transcriptional regulator
VRENRPYLSHDLASEVAFMEARGTTNPLRRMTVRELQTLALVAEGKPYGVIAENLNVSYKTVANTCTKLKAKLGVRTLPELMRLAIQHLPPMAVHGTSRTSTESNSLDRLLEHRASNGALVAPVTRMPRR